jgi:phage-related protein
MATFPNIAPDYGLTKESEPKIREVKFGDGYGQRTTFGLNQNPKTWPITWVNITNAEAAQIEAFLDARAVDCESFTWIQPDVEEQRTNRFANAVGLTGVTIAAGSTTGPDGAVMQKAVVPSGTASFRSIGVGTGNTESFTLASGGTIDVAMSGWFAVGSAGMVVEPRLITSFGISPSTSFVYAQLQINTSNWTVRSKALDTGITEVEAPQITEYSPGVYRVTWVVRYTQGATVRNTTGTYIQLRDTVGAGSFTGDGIGHFQYYGVQAETGSSVTSYISTTTAAVSRYRDNAYRWICKKWNKTMNSYNRNTVTATFEQVYEP